MKLVFIEHITQYKLNIIIRIRYKLPIIHINGTTTMIFLALMLNLISLLMQYHYTNMYILKYKYIRTLK